jgi:predicted alpha/beta superfamily hydrolase
LLACLTLSGVASADDVDTAPAHARLQLVSSVLGETRRINVYVPPRYEACPSRRFPVLYMPDGGEAEDFPHVATAVAELIRTGTIRPVIVVGIENTVRRRDMTPPTRAPADLKVTREPGGAGRFRAFLRDELIPTIEARYRVSDESAIMGESLAGLFVLDALLAHSPRFDTYIALDPSLWWNAGAMARELPERLPPLAGKPARLLFAAAGAETRAVEVTSLVAALKASAPRSLRWEYTPRPDLRHDNVYRALEVPMLKAAFGVDAPDAGDCH